MDHTSHEFLKSLLETPSPSGFEQPIQQVVRERTEAVRRRGPHRLRTATSSPPASPKAGRADAPRIMLAGHCDQIGLMVQHIDDDGFLYVQPIGGWDMQILLGQHLTVWTKAGPVTGVVARRAIHLLTPDERNKVPQFTDVWVDIGAKDKEEAEVARAARRPGHVRARLPAAAQRPGRLPGDGRQGRPVGVHGGACGCCTAGRCRRRSTASRRCRRRSACAARPRPRTHQPDGRHRRGRAPRHRHAGQRQEDAGRDQVRRRAGAVPRAEHQPARLRPARRDREGARDSGAGARRAAGHRHRRQRDADQPATASPTGLIGIPNRYMHSPVEVVHLDDLTNAAKLLAEFCAAVGPDTNWIP